jgi:hypothetical protein
MHEEAAMSERLIAKATPKTPNKCVWKPDSDGTYRTSCGQAFVFTDGGPRENGANFCLYCGAALKERGGKRA